MFNTLRYAKMLEEVGFSRDQAETSVKILVEIMEEKLATKQDMQDLRLEVRHSMNQLKTEVEFSIKRSEDKLTIRMGTMFAAAIAILTAIQKLI